RRAPPAMQMRRGRIFYRPEIGAGRRPPAVHNGFGLICQVDRGSAYSDSRGKKGRKRESCGRFDGQPGQSTDPSSGNTLNKSPTSPMSATSKIAASASLLIA